MEARNNIIKVASLAYEGCLAHRQYEDQVKMDKKARETERSNEYLIGQNAMFLAALSDDVMHTNARAAVLFNGCNLRQSAPADLSNNETGTFILAQDELLKRLNSRLIEKQEQPRWSKDTFLTADAHAARAPGETYHTISNTKTDDAKSTNDTSSLGMLYAQIHKAAFDYQEDEVIFDFYHGNENKLRVLHGFFEANRDLIPQNVTLKLHVYQGTGSFDAVSKVIIPTITHLPEIVGTGEVERDFQQGYLNLIEKSGVDTTKPCDLLAGYINSGDVAKLQAFKASRKLLTSHARINVDGVEEDQEIAHEELKTLVAAINTAKTNVPDTQEGQDFAASLDQVYLKVQSELAKTKLSVKKPANLQKTVNASPAMAAAKRFTRFVQEYNRTAALPNESQEENFAKFRQHAENLATFQQDFKRSYGLRVFQDVAKSAGISLGFLIAAGAIGAGIGFGVGFLAGGPVGALAVGMLGAIIGGAVAAAIGGGLGAGLSVTLFKKAEGRREMENAEQAVLASGRSPALVGYQAG